MEPSSTSLRGFIRWPLIILALSLCACSRPELVQDTAGFEPSARSRPDPADMRVHRFEIVSTSAATWLDADSAERIQAGPLCPDGENWDLQDISPKPAAGRVKEQRFPAGTVFSRTWRCAAKYPGELTFGRGTTSGDAQKLVRNVMSSTDIAGSAVELVLFASYGFQDLKYDVVEKHIGDAVADAIAVCGVRPIRMHAPVIGEWEKDIPPSARPDRLNPMIIGLRIDCEGDAPETS